MGMKDYEKLFDDVAGKQNSLKKNKSEINKISIFLAWLCNVISTILICGILIHGVLPLVDKTTVILIIVYSIQQMLLLLALTFGLIVGGDR